MGTPTQVIVKRREPESITPIRRRPEPQPGTHWVPCGMCGGDPYKHRCPRCGGLHKMPNAGVPITKRRTSGVAEVRRRFTIADIERHGFERAETPPESTPEDTVLNYYRHWLGAPTPMQPFYGEKFHWEMMLARAGWMRPPPPWEEVCARNKPVLREEPKPKKKATDEPVKIVRRK